MSIGERGHWCSRGALTPTIRAGTVCGICGKPSRFFEEVNSIFEDNITLTWEELLARRDDPFWSSKTLPKNIDVPRSLYLGILVAMPPSEGLSAYYLLALVWI